MANYFDNELNHYPYAYDTGHFHRVYVGDVFNNRYRVYRKLGFGCSSTVWLVKDIATGRYLAMKVLSAQASNDGADLCELEILEHLRRNETPHPGQAHTLQLIDHFDHPGSKGLHRCLIFPVMGESLSGYVRKFNDGCVPSHILKRLAFQLLQALDFAHTSGLIHTDIKQDNIMIKLPDESVISDRYLPTTEGCNDPQGLVNK
jgi:serine/threonine-protein kinase SRPK3